MISLGIEGTAHTFGIGIVEDEKILANEKDVYVPKIGSGIVPQEAAKHHEKVKKDVLKKALEKSNLSLKDIDIISYSAGPGLHLPLIVTANFAIQLSKRYKKLLVPVNHSIAHLEIGKLTTKSNDPIFVYLSGGNSQIIAFIEGRYRILGETLDIPIGNCLDVVAREMKLPMPGGREIEKLAKNGKYINLPYLVKGMDFSFSGIATHAIKLIKEGYKFEDIAFSLQETCFAMIVEVTERALAHMNKNEVLLVGGVASNKRLQEMFNIMCSERGAIFKVVEEEYASDNGAMIAYCGLQHYKNNSIPKIKDKIVPKWRIDDVLFIP